MQHKIISIIVNTNSFTKSSMKLVDRKIVCMLLPIIKGSSAVCTTKIWTTL